MFQFTRSIRSLGLAAMAALTVSACGGGGGGIPVTPPSSGGGGVVATCQDKFNPELIGTEDCTPVYHEFCPDLVAGTPVSLDSVALPCNGVTISTSTVTAGSYSSDYVMLKPSTGGGDAFIIALHWAAANGPTMANVMRMAELAKGRNVTIVLPTAPPGDPLSTTGSWGKSGPKIPIPLEDRIALLDQLAALKTNSSSPLLVSGDSGGAIMSFYYGCARTSVSGIEAVAGEITQKDLDACARTTPLAAVLVNGSADLISGLAGANAKAVLAKIQSINGCSGPVSTAQMNPLAGELISSIDISYIQPCAGKGASLVMVQGGGHNWPGMDRNLDGFPANVYGATTKAFDATLQGYDLLRYLGG